MAFLYNFFIHTYGLSVRIASLFNDKAKLWVKGRKNIFEKLRQEVGNQSNIVWFHAASLGEFEQGRPVLEEFKKKHPNYKILLTFFSPSGYEIRKDYEGADFVFYMPLDTNKSVNQFLSIVKPKFVFFIKYEFWFNYLRKLNKMQIPVFIISANFRENQHFFKWYGAWFRNNLSKIDWFFVQNQNSLQLLNSIGISNVTVSGDTRFDRVVEIASKPQKFPLVEEFVKNSFVILAGSSWPEDEKLLSHLFSLNISDFKIIIAPHEIHEDHILQIEKNYSKQKTIRLSKAGLAEIANYNVLIVNGMGFLSSLYQYCQLAYIGGGFGKGIHNILEAVTFGKPVIFGPNYKNFPEAVDLVEKGGAYSIQSESEIKSCVNDFVTLDSRSKTSSTICKAYIEKNKGATQKILQKISQYLQ